MPLRPIGHRVLVLPDAQPETSASGIVLPQDRDHVPVSGSIAAMGPGGDRLRFDARQRAIADCLEFIDSAIRSFGTIAPLLVVRAEVAGLQGSAHPERALHVWDRVVYPAEAGLRVTEDGQDYILLNEDDVVAIATEEEAAA